MNIMPPKAQQIKIYSLSNPITQKSVFLTWRQHDDPCPVNKSFQLAFTSRKPTSYGEILNGYESRGCSSRRRHLKTRIKMFQNVLFKSGATFALGTIFTARNTRNQLQETYSCLLLDKQMNLRDRLIWRTHNSKSVPFQISELCQSGKYSCAQHPFIIILIQYWTKVVENLNHTAVLRDW